MEKNRINRKKCPICNSKYIKHLEQKIGYKIGKCKRCNFQYVINPYTQKEYSQITDSRKMGRLALQQAMTQETQYIWKILDKTYWGKMEKKGNLLDIGCNIGNLLSYARKQGWKVQGVEISKEMVKYCNKEKELNVVSDIEKVTNNFSIITLIDVLEHLINPLKILRTLITYMDTKGIMVISVPITPVGWYLNNTHINYFTAETLIKFLSKLKLEITHFQFHTNNYGLIVIVERK